MSEDLNLQTNHKIIRFLEETKAQSEQVLDDLPGLIAFIDRDGKIYRGNAQLAAILGVGFEDISGCSMASIIPEEFQKIFFNLLKQSTEVTETGALAEINFRDQENNISNFIINIRPNVSQDYGPLGLNLFFVVGTDITQIKSLIQNNSRMEIELQTAKAIQDNLFPAPMEVHQSKMSLAG
ncbi:MAG: PAS domain-containing protein, partial [Bdellovibrionaceae bacterium]|nr:PAS domain-containing protein [Pseudobdellovibrionaceae bacterium]